MSILEILACLKIWPLLNTEQVYCQQTKITRIQTQAALLTEAACFWCSEGI